MRMFVPILCSLLLISLNSLHADTQQARPDKVKFGVNGHPLVAGAYSEPLEDQISQLKSLGLRAYRVNVNPANMTPEKFERLSRLINLAQQQEIEILITIVIKAQDYSSESDAYDAAKSATNALSQQIGQHIGVWELGNEYDLYCVIKGASGRAPADYDTEKYLIVRGLIRGMLAGLRDGSPKALRVVQTSQNGKNPDSGFLQRLIHDGIEFDITGYHYYSHDGHIRVADNGESALQILRDNFHKPIWITEFDQASHDGVGPNADPTSQAQALERALQAIAQDARQYDVKQAYIYELLDQPELSASKPVQAQFGILHADGGATDASAAVRRFLQSYY